MSGSHSRRSGLMPIPLRSRTRRPSRACRLKVEQTHEARMVTMVVESDQVSVPLAVNDLASFRSWAHSDDFPEQGRICFLEGEVWIDMSREQLFTHVILKGEFSRVLGTIVLEENLGRLFPDGALLTS